MTDSIDKIREKKRYDKIAEYMLKGDLNAIKSSHYGAVEMPLPLRAPYVHFESEICKHVTKSSKVLEICSGTGMHTGILLDNAGSVVATDISEISLEVLKRRYKGNKILTTKVADMESLPFDDSSFDVVTSAGSLSYGDNYKVMMEIYRVIKPGGIYICVDSLNHNWIYKINRWLHYIRGERTLNTLKRMPRLDTIEAYGQKFGSVNTNFFGAASWLSPLLSHIFGDERASQISESFDNLLNTKM